MLVAPVRTAASADAAAGQPDQPERLGLVQRRHGRFHARPVVPRRAGEIGRLRGGR
jgi:hypothetical protein